ncbi:MAG: hypothetical protein IPI67_39165 [Myxococcales bacterium]|nr:hypothetical protein [Myxococcales bacterium]
MSMFRTVKACVFLLSAGLVFSTGACGGDDGDGGGGSGGGGGSAGSLFACDTPAKFACFEIAITAGPGQQAAADQCTSDGGTATTACPTASVAGECLGAIHYFYYSGFSGLDKAQQVCEGLGSTWSTP